MYIANFSERVVDIVVEAVATPTPATSGFEIVLGLLGTGLAYRLRRK